MRSKKESKLVVENIVDSHMTEVLVNAFNRYAKAVITDRAIPDVRDGLKPVQRRIIFGMYDRGYLFSKETVKCATIVGHVMGHLHPHGDASIYDALVHLAQSWKMEEPLVDFQGNSGSIDDDPAASMRYTEARLSKLSDLMVKDLNKETVEMVLTFDDKMEEPTVLPSKFPNLLVNGTQGIAVGSTTYIPTHNLREVIDATIYRITHKRSNLDDIIQFLPAPDFPTGGIIDDKESIRNLYETGRGSFYLHCHYRLDESRNEIIIDQIPYGVVKKMLVADLVKRKETDNLDNVEEIIDQSAEDYIAIVIKVKKGASMQDVVDYYISKGAFRSTISCNFLAIVKGHPKTLPLLEIIDSYIDHQRDVETKAAAYDLKMDKKRLEIVDGLVKVYSILDEVIEKIKKCSGKESVKKMLQADYGFTENQSEAIAMLPLYRLSNTDIMALRKEKEDLNADINRLKEILSDSEKLDRLIVNNLKQIRKDYGSDRKTEIRNEKISYSNVDKKKLISRDDVYVAVTMDGYAKRTSPSSYQAYCQANKDDLLHLPKLKVGDKVVFNRKCSTHDSLLFFTDKGNYGYLPIYLLPEIKWKEEGKHLNNLLALKPSEKIVRCFQIEEFYEGAYVILLTKNNKIVRIPLVQFKQDGLTKRTIKACSISAKENDAVVSVAITGGNSDVIVTDALGRSSRFNENDIPVTNIGTNGVKAIASAVDHQDMVDMVALQSDEAPLLLVLADKRAARLIRSAKIETTERLQRKTDLVRIFKKNPMKIVSLSKVVRIKGETNVIGVMTENLTVALDLDKLDPIDLGSEMRQNVEGLGNELVIGIDQAGDIIDSTLKIEKSKVSKVQKSTIKKEQDGQQMSLFDLFESNK